LLRDSVYSYIFLYSTLKEDKNTFKLMQLEVSLALSPPSSDEKLREIVCAQSSTTLTPLESGAWGSTFVRNFPDVSTSISALFNVNYFYRSATIIFTDVFPSHLRADL
jgi:hypothetical protein